MYGLSNLVFLYDPITLFSAHRKVFIMGASHCNIYSETGRNTILREYKKNPCLKNNFPKITYTNELHDLWLNGILNKKYIYYKPLCLQVFPHTENISSWGNDFIYSGIRLLKLDTQYEPGWTILYVLFYIFNLMIYLFLMIIIYYFVKYIISLS